MTKQPMKRSAFITVLVFLFASSSLFAENDWRDVTVLTLALAVLDLGTQIHVLPKERSAAPNEMQRAIAAHAAKSVLVLDVDGTLTPVPGENYGSLFQRSDVERLVEEWQAEYPGRLKRLAAFLNRQESFVLVTRSQQERVFRFLRAIGVDTSKISGHSRYRDAPEWKTRSKMPYVKTLPFPVVFFDDDARNFATETTAENIVTVHCSTWLPDMPGFDQLR